MPDKMNKNVLVDDDSLFKGHYFQIKFIFSVISL